VAKQLPKLRILLERNTRGEIAEAREIASKKRSEDGYNVVLLIPIVGFFWLFFFSEPVFPPEVQKNYSQSITPQ